MMQLDDEVMIEILHDFLLSDGIGDELVLFEMTFAQNFHRHMLVGRSIPDEVDSAKSARTDETDNFKGRGF